MSKCESNVDELIVPGLVGIPGTVSSRLAEYRDWRGDVQADVSDLETCASNLEIQGLAITAIDFVNPCARYSEVSFERGDDAIHARLIEPVGRARVSERVPLCLMFHDIDRPVRGWHHMTRFAAMGYAVLALDDDVAGADDLQREISSPAFVERVRWGCALAKVARNLDGMDPDRIFAWGEG
ncbi:MAG: acetylxylan esterase, partial [Collinsella sp.]|nr:acetylxylan esterase [Collinsella sp.]